MKKFSFLSKIILIILLFSLTKSQDEKKKRKKFERIDSVLTITPTNFFRILNKYKSILIEFTNHSPKHLFTSISNDVTQASLLLYKEKPRLNIGRIYLIDYPDFKNTFESYFNIKIIKIPALFYFHNESIYNYTGTISRNGIYQWMLKRNQPILKELFTLNEILNFKNTHEFSLIYFGDNQTIINYLKEIGENDAEIFYAFSKFKDNYLDTFHVKENGMILYKKFGEDQNILSNVKSKEGILNFIKKYSFNKVLIFNDATIKKIWEDKNPGIFFFIDDNNPDKDVYEKIMNELADDYYGKIIFVKSNYIVDKNILRNIYVIESRNPTIRIVDSKKWNRPVFIFKEKFTYAKIKKFLDDFFDNKLHPVLRSENEKNFNLNLDDIKDNSDKIVKGIINFVSSKFYDVVENYNKTFIILFYKDISYSNDKRKFMLNFDRKFKNFADKNIIVGKLNLNKNELDESLDNEFEIPTLRIYKYNKEKSYKNIYNLDNNLNKYTQFLNNYLNLNLIDDYEKEEL